MVWRVEIREKEGVNDCLGQSIAQEIVDLGLTSVKRVRTVSVYLLYGPLDGTGVEKICRELLCDPVVQEYRYAAKPLGVWPFGVAQGKGGKPNHTVEIAYNPGVMDPVEASTVKAIRDLGVVGIRAVRTAKQYLFWGKPSKAQVASITSRVLMNKLIQHAVVKPADPFKDIPSFASNDAAFDIVTVDLLEASDKGLADLSRQGQLYLNLNEMKAVRDYFRKEKRNPTDVELETIAQTWSEHCCHKTFRGIIRYTAYDGKRSKTIVIRSLFKSFIAKVTRELNKPWCVSVFHDNAGVIAFDDDYHVCFKVETHNHPSALEPFGGANTGVGGVIRDTLGTGLAAKPLCNTDIFCFAPPDMPVSQLPAGTLHPQRVMKGVVSGVRDYGNKMGIPTVNGAIVFDRGFAGNPLVFCGNVGLIPKGKENKKVSAGELIVTMGGRTGRDGIHGATFSSGELTGESETISSGAVQIGNPIEEKKVLDALLKARDKGLYSAITDCGAGGFSSAVGEMGQEAGARVDLDKAPLKYEGLRYDEIWISESQERMVLAVPPAKINEFLKLCAGENVEAAVIGEFGGKRLRLFYRGRQVADLGLDFVHNGLPQITKEAVYHAPVVKKEKLPTVKKDLTADLRAALGHNNVASKESVIRVYDHEVQGTSVIKPLVGVAGDGPSDAAVLRPRLDSNKGIAVSNGINVRYGMIDPFWMAASCIDEAIRQIVAVGGDVERIALLDNFCWGNPDKSDRLGTLVRCAQGCYEFAKAFGAPFISGKDSLYNEYTWKGRSLAIPGTVLISALGIIDDVRRCVTMDFKRSGNAIYMVGMTRNEMGGSVYLDNHGQLGSGVPKVDAQRAMQIYQTLRTACRQGLAQAMHDCSEGGLAVALAEMAFAGGLGVTVSLKNVPYQGVSRREDIILFSESNSRMLVEVAPAQEASFVRLLKDTAHAKIGIVEQSPEFLVYGLKDAPVIHAGIDDLKNVWQSSLK